MANEYISAGYLDGFFDVNDKDASTEDAARESASRIFDRLVGVADGYFVSAAYPTVPADIQAAVSSLAVFILRHPDIVTILEAGGSASDAQRLPIVTLTVAEAWRLKMAAEKDAAAIVIANQNPLRVRSLRYF